MIIHVWRGDLKVPVKVFCLISLALCLVLVLCIRLLHLQTPGQETLCTDGYSRQAYTERLQAPGKKSAGCSEDPAVINTWASCPTCFRPTVENISKKFIEVSNKHRLYPRGPRNYFKLHDTVQQNFIRDVVISPTTVCVNTCPYLLGMQLSVSDRFDERDAIRATWGSVAKTKIWPHASMNADFEILFVLAHKSRRSEAPAASGNTSHTAANSEEMQLILAEANRHGDILYLDMIDSYFNLTLKLVSTLHWVRNHCPRTKFFLKVDADTFVNVPLLVDLLIYNEHLLEFSVTGHMYAGDKYVYRDGRWAVNKDVYPIPTFPVYASGCAYVISRAALSKVMDIFPFFPMIDLEDVHITGILGTLARLHFYSSKLSKVFTEYHSDMWDWCYFMNDTLVTGTGVNRVFKKRLIWSGFVLNDWICRTKNLLKMPCYCEEEFGAQDKGAGCAYVISASALFTMVSAAPYIPVIPIEDAFITGILARVGHIQVIDGSQGLFTHFKDFYWQRCQMVRHTKLVGTLAGGPRGAGIWAAIIERNETCFEEDYSYVFEQYYKLIVVG